MNAPTLGIDFGTTKTLASFYNPQTRRPETIRLGRGSDYLPTTVYVAEDGSFLFGDVADDEMLHDAKRYSRGFKMRLGTPVSAIGFFDGTRYHKYSAKELCCAFLAHVKKECEEHAFVGKQVQRAVITCPVSFSAAQRAELEEAAHQAGFAEVRLITEPEAAGLAFCTLCPDTCFKGNALIVDWGGGTLDMALVSREGDRVNTHSQYTSGDIEMGGEAFDMRLWNHTREQLLSDCGIDLKQETPEIQGKLLSHIRLEKEMLSRQEQRKIRLSSSKGACPPVGITRDDFERLIADDVEKASHMALQLNSSIDEAHLKPEMLLLVGGTSRVPCIATALEASVGLPCHKWQYSREAVSLGAALLDVNIDNETKVAAEENEPVRNANNAQSSVSVTSEDDKVIQPSTSQSSTFDNRSTTEVCKSNAPSVSEDKEERQDMLAPVKRTVTPPPLPAFRTRPSITGVWKGSCTNTALNITAPMEVSFHQDGNEITGYLKIKSDELGGSGELTGTISGDSIKFSTTGMLLIYKSIEWEGRINGKSIQGRYNVISAKIGSLLKSFMGVDQEFGVFELSKLD